MEVTARAVVESTDAIRLVSIGIIFAVSFIAAGFPTAAQRLRFLRVPSFLFFAGKHFGTGVILSTAFIHLLSDAFLNLSDKQIAGLSNLPGLITLGSLLLIFLIEYLSTVYVESIASSEETSDKAAPSSPSVGQIPSGNGYTHASQVDPVSRLSDREVDAQTRQRNEHSPLLSRREAGGRDEYFDVYMHHHDHGHQEGHCLETERRDKMVQLLGVLVLQLGIMLHSFVIGMTLAVTTPSHLPSLLSAIIFHQLFEGLSLGVRFSTLPTSIPAPPSPPSSPSHGIPPQYRSIRYVPMLLTFLFGITTPVGIAVGLIIKSTMHASVVGSHAIVNTAVDSIPGGSTFRGVMSAISAGLLIYASCVELLAGDFVNDADLRKSSRGRQAVAIISLLCGAVAMAWIR